MQLLNKTNICLDAHKALLVLNFGQPNTSTNILFKYKIKFFKISKKIYVYHHKFFGLYSKCLYTYY